ncbi:MAG: site-2 protease family protein [Methanobacterium sp.]|nr:site-2 protease family protein [Methanobacterium sp.]
MEDNNIIEDYISKKQTKTVSLIENYVLKYFSIKNTHVEKKTFYLIVWNYDRDKFVQLVDDLDKIGYLPFIDEYKGEYKINIVQKPEHNESRVHINVILFLITIISTISAGYFFNGINLSTGTYFTVEGILNGTAFSMANLIQGITFSAALLAIIGTHETAHYFAARKHNVKATLPYFIPAPTLIGTFGAVINVKSAIPDKNALFDLGASGPIAGFIVTVPVLIIGVLLSNIGPIQNTGIYLIPSPLMYISFNFFFTSVPDGYTIMLSPIAFAAWVGIIVTMLNLMPVAFLDGGHISRSLFNEKIHKIISFIGISATLILGWIPMGILMIIVLFISKRHPGALDNVSKMSRNRKILSVVMVIIFILCLSPIPITQI